MSDSNIVSQIFETYRKKFPVCKEHHEKLINYIPGGATRSLSYFKPFPVHIDRGAGARRIHIHNRF